MHSEEEIADKQNDSNTTSENNQNKKKNERWHCPICKDELKSPVVTPCGHIFCWPCISKHLQDKEEALRVCPVCSKPLDLDKVVPIYGQTNQAKDNEAPPPPKAERVETEEEIFERNNQNQYYRQNNNFNFEFGFFPFAAGVGFTYVNGVGFQRIGRNRNQGNQFYYMLFAFLLPVIVMFVSNLI